MCLSCAEVGTPPNVMFINCEPLCPVLNTECTLNLCIKDFCPKRISVTWTVDGEPVDSSCVFNTPPSLNVNGLYAMYSFLKLHPTQTKRNQCYRCKVEHSNKNSESNNVLCVPPLEVGGGQHRLLSV
uniref:Ig-like domain-containing protein n=1 Tax=Periophthalmus magnuspinnatus TaxID=409849 RepID=A0A3B4A1N9_9GOBI